MKNYKQTDLFQEEEALTLYAEATRVSRFPLPDVKKAKKIRDTSGRNILDSLENYVQVTSLERTWADIFDSVWIPYSRIWTARTTPSGALVLKQRVSVPRTDAKESSGLRFPTPRASDVEGGIVEDVELNNGSFSRRNKKGERRGVKLRDAANYLDKKERAQQQMWPTPQAMDGMRSGQIRKREELSEAALRGGCSNLREAVHDPKYLEQNMWPTPNASPNTVSQTVEATLNLRKRDRKQGQLMEAIVEQMLPTPTARDWKGPRKPETLKKNGRLPSNSLPDKVRSEVMKSEEKLHLNPTWVEGMMGFPHGWTDLGNEESPE